MTIQDLGSLGELIAAIATVATLIYLAIQIRENTHVTRAESRRGENLRAGVYSGIIGASKEVASVFRRGLAEPDSLDPDEHIQFLFLFSMLVDQASCALEEYNLGVTNIAVLEVACKPILDMLKTPGGARFWKSHHVGFKPEFREYVDSELANSSG